MEQFTLKTVFSIFCDRSKTNWVVPDVVCLVSSLRLVEAEKGRVIINCEVTMVSILVNLNFDSTDTAPIQTLGSKLRIVNSLRKNTQ